MKKVDINCDMGEGFGIYQFGNDEQILPFITSANIACGFHAGDYNVMAKTIEMALKNKVAIGAHPGYPDVIGFGRRSMSYDPKEIYHMLLYQIGALQGMTKALGGKLQHVKPHGALYNLAAVNQQVAIAVVEAIYDIAPNAVVFGLADSLLTKAGVSIGLKVGHEIFVDRTYLKDGTLMPRSEPGAVINDPKIAVAQCIQMLKMQKVSADTICIHGDHLNAIDFVKKLRTSILESGYMVEAIGTWKKH